MRLKIAYILVRLLLGHILDIIDQMKASWTSTELFLWVKIAAGNCKNGREI